MTRWRVLLLAATAALPAHAADVTEKPVVAPPPAWVIPAKLPADLGKPDEAAVRLLLSDQQVRLTRDGQEIYGESLIRVQTPQGLQLLGNITLPWKPDTSTLTVHKLRILRGPQVIDLLKDGPGFTVLRRENKLEYATLDGVLTAVVQPEGLQVGDVVDIATTTAVRDPVLAGHPEGALGGWGNVPIDHVSSRAVWDDGLPVRWRATEGTPPVREVKRGGTTEISLSADALAPVLYPKDAPPRFALPRLVEATSYRSWADLSALFAPLYARTAAIAPGSPLAAEVAKIAAASPDPVLRTEAALALVQDRVRYVFLGMNDGGLMPAAADLTWQRRFGDCKGKTALLVAMLKALGITAEPAIVSTAFGDGLDQRLPMVALFDHILVRTTIAGRTYWLDGTRTGDRRLADVTVPPFRWALPVRTAGATLERLVQEPAARPFSTLDIRIDAGQGIGVPAPFHAESVLRGDAATQLKLNLANLTPAQRDQGLRDFWTGKYDFLTVKTATAAYDDRTGEERLTVDGTAAMDWSNGSYEADGVGVGWTADFTRPDGPHQDAPFAVGFPAYERTTETILLPNGGKGFAVDTPDVDRTVAGLEYHRTARLAGATYTVEMTARSVVPEFPASAAATYQAALRALSKQRVFLKKTKDFVWTEQDRSALIAAQPKEASGFYDRAAAHFQRQEWRQAIADYTEYLRTDADDAGALAWRGTARLRLGELDAADADLKRAIALDPKSVQAHNAATVLAMARNDPPRAMREADQAVQSNTDPKVVPELLARRIWVAKAAGDSARMAADRAEFLKRATPRDRAALAVMLDDTEEAVTALDAALRAEPADLSLLQQRAQANYRLQRYERALADGAAVLKAKPDVIDLYLMRANIHRRMGRNDLVLADAIALTAANPQSDYAHVVAATTYAALDRKPDALREFDRAIALKPTVYAYLTRASNRAADDTAGKRADIEAAAKLDPDDRSVRTMRLGMALKDRDFDGVLRSADAALRTLPHDPALLNYRGMAQAALAHRDLAARDFADARAAVATSAEALNNLCWTKATAGIALDEALVDCDAALKREPGSAAALDSRAFVLFRLGRYEEARLGYDAAVKRAPKQAASIYVRGLAKVKLGRIAEGREDIAAAQALAPRVAEEFAGYGVTA